MRVLGIIPARYDSTRFPGKPLVEIFGKPMIQWVYESCINASSLDRVIVATDDERIEECVNAFSGEVILTSKDHKSGTDRCAEVCSKLEESDETYNLIINIQGDEPFLKPKNIDDLVLCMKQTENGIGTLGRAFINADILDNPNRVKIRQKDEKLNFFRVLNDEEDYGLPGIKHIGMYAYRSEVLHEISSLPPSENEKRLNLEQQRWLDNGYKIALALVDSESPSVDTKADLDYILSKGKEHWC